MTQTCIGFLGVALVPDNSTLDPTNHSLALGLGQSSRVNMSVRVAPLVMKESRSEDGSHDECSTKFYKVFSAGRVISLIGGTEGTSVRGVA